MHRKLTRRYGMVFELFASINSNCQKRVTYNQKQQSSYLTKLVLFKQRAAICLIKLQQLTVKNDNIPVCFFLFENKAFL
ncbi:hypothetical protein Hanom_Chr03g00227601 [Helianthus anomalus]